jgi:MFS transporter, DHA1 family, inner membrane transport protein
MAGVTGRGVPNRILLLALALGAFTIGTDSLVISGLLVRVAASIHVSTTAAGQLITAFALVYAVGAPVLATLTGTVRRKRLLLIALTVFTIANLLGSVAPDYPVLMVARLLAALGAALYMPSAMTVTVGITPQQWRGRALAIVVGGLSAATALGVPLGTLIGAIGDWRMTLLLVAVLAIAAGIVIAVALPEVPSPAVATIRQRARAGTHPSVLAALLSNLLACAGEYTVFVYITPLVIGLTKTGTTGVSAFLLVSGIAAVIGSVAGGRAADKFGGHRTYTGAVTVLFTCLSAMALLALYAPRGSWITTGMFGALLCVTSISCWALPPAQNHRIASLDIPEPSVALSLNGSSSYLGLAAGGAVGGIAMASGSITVLTRTAAGVELLALVTLAASSALLSRGGQVAAAHPGSGSRG